MYFNNKKVRKLIKHNILDASKWKGVWRSGWKVERASSQLDWWLKLLNGQKKRGSGRKGRGKEGQSAEEAEAEADVQYTQTQTSR